jgi:hypothetical protein
MANLGIKKKSLSSSDNSDFYNEAEGARTLNLRIDSPRAYPAKQTKNAVFYVKNKVFLRSDEGQPKVKSTCLARTLARAW